MITVLIIGLMAVTFAYFAKYKKLRFCLKISFIIIFLFLALRYDYGPDYNAYLDDFNEIKQLNFNIESIKDIWVNSMFVNMILPESYESHLPNREPGWLTLCFLFQPLGFFPLVAFLALFNCLVYYCFIKKYVPPAYYWLAVFLYVFTPNIMLVQSVIMRQTIAILLFIMSISYIYKKNFLQYAFMIILAMLFHTSAIILLPLYLLGALNVKMKEEVAISVFFLFVMLIFLAEPMSPIINNVISSYIPRYAIYDEPGTVGTGLGIVFMVFILFLLLLYDQFQSREISLLFKIAILGVFTIPFSLIIMMISRINFYISPVIIVAYPFIFIKANKIFKNPLFFQSLFAVAIVSWTLFMFLAFFQSDVYQDSFSTYSTIFSSPVLH